MIQAPTPFPGNVIPANRIDPISRQLTDYYPLPLEERTGANYVNDEARRIDADQFTYRLDFTQSSNASWFFRHSISHELGYDPFPIPDMGINTDTDVQQVALGYTRTFGSNKLNDVRVGFGQAEERPHLASRQRRQRRRTARHQPAERQPALLGRSQHRHHRSRRASARRVTRRSSTTTRRSSSSTTSRGRSGKHSFKFGGELRHVRYDQIGGVVTRGRWAFDGRYTQNPLLPTAQRGGSAFADFLLGHFNRSEGQVGAPIANFRSNYFARLRAGQLEARVEPDGQLRPALGVRPAVPRRRTTRS